MNSKDIRQLSKDDILARLDEAKASMNNLRFKQGTGQLENPLEVRHLRRSIARLSTLLREADLNLNNEN
jgi:large subunit ribosomal protein L29